MPKFAVIDGVNVINTIMCESKTIAEEITGKTCIEYTTEPAEAGGTYENMIFLQKKPYPSWVLNDSNNWVPPIPHPTDDKIYTWDESTINWVEVTE